MKVLQITKKFPYPAKDGESIAILSMAEGYHAADSDVDLLAMNTQKHYVRKEIRDNKPHFYNFVRSIDINSGVRFLAAFSNLFTQKSYNIERFISSDFRAALISQLSANLYDFIQLETLYLVPYIEVIREYSDAKIVFRSHNMEYEIWENLARSETTLLKKWYYYICYKRLRKYELDNIKNYDLLVAITEQDLAKYVNLGFSSKAIVAPVGIRIKSAFTHTVEPDQNGITIGYIGSLDWRPNLEGLLWFFDDVWPILLQKYPLLKFHLAGRGASNSFQEGLPHNVVYHGEVESANDFLSDLDGVIAPLISGSGIRVKILESMALGKSVMSTTKGFEGIPITNGKQAILFDHPDELVGSFDKWYNDATYRSAMSEQAHTLIRNNFNIKSIAIDILKEVKLVNNRYRL